MRLRRTLVLGVLLTVAAAGCGQAKDNGIATANGAGATPSASATPKKLTAQEVQDASIKFAQCMRENGLPDFPDPEVEDGRISLQMPAGGADKATVDAAMEKCRQFMPNGGERPEMDPAALEEMRKYAQCMRDNGVPDFPDPSEDGGLMIDGDQINPNSAEFKAADTACEGKRPGGPSGGPAVVGSNG